MGNLFSERRKVNNTNLSLPTFGMGTAHLGELYGRVEEHIAQATFEAAWGSGVRYFDTAPWYGRGLAEHRLGSFLRTKPRNEFLVTTKVVLCKSLHPQNFDREPWHGGLNFEVKFDYSYDGIKGLKPSFATTCIGHSRRISHSRFRQLFHDENNLETYCKSHGVRSRALDELKSGK